MELAYGPRFRMLHWCTDQFLTEALSQMELTASQGQIMGFIAKQPSPPCPRDIEERFGLSHPSVSGTLSRLQRKGFLEFRPDPRDRRCKRIYILPRGRECHERMTEQIQSIEGQIVAGFSPEEQAVFRQLLDRAIGNLGGPCGPCQKEEHK